MGGKGPGHAPVPALRIQIRLSSTASRGVHPKCIPTDDKLERASSKQRGQGESFALLGPFFASGGKSSGCPNGLTLRASLDSLMRMGVGGARSGWVGVGTWYCVHLETTLQHRPWQFSQGDSWTQPGSRNGGRGSVSLSLMVWHCQLLGLAQPTRGPFRLETS